MLSSILTLSLAGPEGPATASATWDVRERVRCDLLVILAHPDDEGVVAPLVAREALESAKRVGVVYLTDGRNGTNRAGSLAGRSFGIVRLTEASWTLRRLGVSVVRSLDLADGLGRGDPAVVLGGWGREATVAELARLVRLLRPREIITWFPGPAASNPDHAAAGAAALLAAVSAADPSAWPEQLRREGLEPHPTPAIWLVAQPEKVGYALYPDPRRGAGAPSDGARVMDLDVASPTLGRRYTDIAREALREQRAVGAASNLGRGGAFDEPLRLLPVDLNPGRPVEIPRGDGAGQPGVAFRIRVGDGASLMQLFLESLAGEIGADGLVEDYAPEISAAPGGTVHVAITATWAAGMKGRLSLDLPRGWKSEPSRREVAAAAGESVTLEWTVSLPEAVEAGHYEGGLVARPTARDHGEQRAPFVVTVPRRGSPGMPIED